MAVENEVFHHLEKLLFKKYNVIQGVRIGDEEYDIIAAGRELFYRDYIF